MVVRHRRYPPAREWQVLLLDSDNIPVRDLAPLFESPLFVASGALLWPDYWESAAAPDAAAVLALPAGTALPAGSFESGQMLFNKRRQGRHVTHSSLQ